VGGGQYGGDLEGYDEGESGGTTDMLLSQTVHITAAQIKNLSAAPVEIVPLVPGKILLPVSYVARFTAGALPYQNGDGGLKVSNGNSDSGHTAWKFADIDSSVLLGDSSVFGETGVEYSTGQTGDFQDWPISMFLGGLTDYTDGDGTINITVWYVVTP
jgi:hypothetical protein